MPPRKLFDEYISYLSTTITEVNRIAATLNNPNEEPAERMIKENERKEGFFCTKFRVGHGKIKSTSPLLFRLRNRSC